MHRCFEQVHWLDEGPQISDVSLHECLQRLSPGSSQINGVIQQFRKLLEHDNLYNLLSTSNVREQHVIPNLDASRSSESPNRIEVHTEKRLAVLMDHIDHVESDSGSLVEGIVDRLVLVYQGGCVVAAEIIDFKVDQIDASNLTERIEHYRPQLTAYRAAIQQMLGLPEEQISTRLVFVRSGHVVQVDCLDQKVDQDTDLKLPRKPKVLSQPKENVATPSKASKPKSRKKVKEEKSPSEIQQTFWGEE
jgi:hypothetical protein